MCVLNVLQCPVCMDDFVTMQYVTVCQLYYTRKEHCPDLLLNEVYDKCCKCSNDAE